MTYLLVAITVTVVIIGLAWRGLGTENGDGGTARPTQPRPRPTRPSRPTAPDDDPEFLNEIDRRLRGEDKK